MPSAPQPDRVPVAPVSAEEVERNGSGAQALIGYHLDLTGADGAGRVILDIDDRHLNRHGSLHGGIVAMMLDAASGFAVSRASDGPVLPNVATVSLNTNYVAPARGGRRVTAVGHVTGGGRKVVFASAQLLDQDGTLLATASGVFRCIRA